MTPSIRRRRAGASCTIALLAACARSNAPVVSPTPTEAAASNLDVFVKASPVGRVTTLADFQPDLAAIDGPFECGGREAAGESGIMRTLFGPGAVTFSAVFPSRAETRATADVTIDSAGKIIHYAERRGPAIHPVVAGGGPESSASADEVAAAAAAVRSTIISLDFRRNRGRITNHGGGRPDESASGPADVVGSMEQYGKPLDRARRVLAQCQARQ